MSCIDTASTQIMWSLSDQEVKGQIAMALSNQSQSEYGFVPHLALHKNYLLFINVRIRKTYYAKERMMIARVASDHFYCSVHLKVYTVTWAAVTSPTKPQLGDHQDPPLGKLGYIRSSP